MGRPVVVVAIGLLALALTCNADADSEAALRREIAELKAKLASVQVDTPVGKNRSVSHGNRTASLSSLHAVRHDLAVARRKEAIRENNAAQTATKVEQAVELAVTEHFAATSQKLATCAVEDFNSLADELQSTVDLLRSTAKDVGKRKTELIALRAGRTNFTNPSSFGSFGGLSSFGSGAPSDNERNWPAKESQASDSTMAAYNGMAKVVDFGLRASHQGSAPAGRGAAPQRQASQAPAEEYSGDTFSVQPGREAAPFGEEAVAHELQHRAGETQDTLVDAMEQAEVAEIKRSIFRALTRLRSASIKEFDTIARLETQAIDAYNDAHNYRGENPLRHLHEDESEYTTDKLKSFHSA